MKKYPKYKDSGIEWIGEIPEHWDTTKIKYNTYVKGRIGWQGLTTAEYVDEGPYLVTGTDFDDGGINWNTCHHVSEERYQEDPYIMLKNDDILITKDGTIGKVAIVNDLPGKTTLNSGVFVTRPTSDEYISPYLYWVLKSNSFTKFIDLIKMGSTIPHLYQKTFVEFQFNIPTANEQQAIADYLDKKTGLIDELIEKKQRQIKLLKEQRQAVINLAVTKGLDPDVEMKDSRLEWLGEIPKHWEVKKLKWIVSKIGSGVTPRGGAQVYQDEGVPLLRSQNVHFDGLRLDDVAYITDEIHQSMKNSQVKANDVLLNITGASIGRCSVVPVSIGEANVNQHVCIMRPTGNVMSDYLHLVMSSNIGQLQVFYSQNGTSREGLNFEQLGNFIIPLPNIDEQEQVVCKSTELVNGIYASISKAKQQIQFLQEYRTALISEAVTGKIDVREAV